MDCHHKECHQGPLKGVGRQGDGSGSGNKACSQSRRSFGLPLFRSSIATRGLAFHFHLLSSGAGAECSPSLDHQTPTPKTRVQDTHAHARQLVRWHRNPTSMSICCLGASTSTLAGCR